MKYLTIQGMLVVLSMLMAELALSQELPRPYAHYPLNVVEKYDPSRMDISDIRTYDVSGHGRHGSVFIDGATFPLMRGVKIDRLAPHDSQYDYFLKFETFSTTAHTPHNGAMPYASKPDYSKSSYVSVPDPYQNYDLSTGGHPATITFWYKNTGRNTDAIVGTPGLLISNNQGALQVNMPIAEFLTLSIDWNNFFPLPNGWYFVAIALNFSDNGSIDVYKYFVADNGTGFLEGHTSMDHLTRSNGVEQNIARNPQAFPVTGALMGLGTQHGEFDGVLRDVQFYRTTLTREQINTIRVQDYKLLTDDIDTSHYVNKGVYSFYPFDAAKVGPNGQIVDQGIGANNGTVSGGHAYATDRFGRSSNSFGLEDYTSHITLADFFPDYDETKGVTISFWAKVDGSIPRPKGVIPFEEATDTRYKFFYADNSAGKTLWGMQHIKGNLGQKKYLTNLSGQKDDWFDWFLQEASFNNAQIGGTDKWYHVVLVSDKWRTHAYIGTMQSEMGCDQSPLYDNRWDSDEAAVHNYNTVQKIRECNAILDFNGMQDLSATSGLGALTWGIGNKNGGTEAVAGNIDDFRIYNWPMHPYEVKALHSIEKKQPPAARVAKEAKPIDPPPVVAENFSIFPNPTTGTLNIRFFMQQSGTVRFDLFDMAGRQVVSWNGAQGAAKGTNQVVTIDLKAKGVAAGVYNLKLTGAGINRIVKVVVL